MNVLIINGSGSIGSELVKMGNSLDHSIFYTSNRAEDGNNHSCINWNYSGSKSVSNLFEKLKDKCSQIDAVANCLGSIFLKPAHLTSEKDLDETLDINPKSSFFILKESIP